MLTCHNRVNRLLSWNIQDDAHALLESTKLSHLSTCMFENINQPLISAFVERWHPETNSFHMPFGEMTITLHDVSFILNIPVARHPIITETSEIAISSIKTQMTSLLNMSMDELEKIWKRGTIKFDIIKSRATRENVK